MTRSSGLLLGEILEAIALLRQYTAGFDFEQFAKNTEKQDAVMRRLEIIGEAVKRLPDELKSRRPTIPWKDIAGARDVLVHEYFRVDLAMTWGMVHQDLASLETAVESLLREIETEGDA